MRVVAWMVVLSAGVFSACSDLVTGPGAAPAGVARLDEYGSGDSCDNGFTAAQCAAIQEALTYLQTHPDPLCSTLGFEAQYRFNSGQFHYDPTTTDEGWTYDGTAGTYLGSNAFDPGELANTIAHEESHHDGFEDLRDGSGNDAYRAGDGCAGYI